MFFEIIAIYRLSNKVILMTYNNLFFIAMKFLNSLIMDVKKVKLYNLLHFTYKLITIKLLSFRQDDIWI